MSFEESISVYSLAFSGIGVLAETDQKIFLRLLFERVSLPTLSNFDSINLLLFNPFCYLLSIASI